MQVHQLESFVVLAEELNYRRAADRLALSQPGLSEQIRTLEQALGVSLFIRDRSGTRLTPQGHQLIPLASAAVDAVKDLVTAAGSSRSDSLTTHSKRLRIGMLGDGVGDATWLLLERFNQTRPDVQIEIKPLDFTEAFHAIELHSADVVLAIGPATPTDRQRVTSVGCEPIATVMTSGNPLASCPDIELELVARRLTFDLPHGIDPLFRRFWLQQPLREKAGRYASVLRPAQDTPMIPELKTQVGRAGAIGLWPARLPAAPTAGVVVRPLAQPLHAPRQILSNRHDDNATHFARLAENTVPPQCPICDCSSESWPENPAAGSG